MKQYTIEEQNKIGKEIAHLLCMKKDRQNKDRYQTTWGNKTAIGLFSTILRLAEDINEGKEIKA